MKVVFISKNLMFEYWGGYNIGCKQWVVVLAISVIEKG